MNFEMAQLWIEVILLSHKNDENSSFLDLGLQGK